MAVPAAYTCLTVLALLASAGCIVDDDVRCSPGQQLDDGLCRCPVGATIVNNACVVTAIDAGGLDASAAPEGGLGAACDVNSPCTGPTFTRCQEAPSGASYCTATCSSTGDCAAGHHCDTSGAPAICRRPFVGQDVPCESASTCTGDARFCSGFLHVCLVAGCVEGDNGSCDPGYTCFNAGAFMPGMPHVCVKRELLGP